MNIEPCSLYQENVRLSNAFMSTSLGDKLLRVVQTAQSLTELRR